MRDHQAGVLPLRPLTTGEVLDAAVVLLRSRPGHLLLTGLVVALLEQAVLFPLRRLADVDSSFLPGTGLLGEWGLLVVVSLATEALCIGVSGGRAAAHAPRALLGPSARPRPHRAGPLAVALAAVAVLCAASGWIFLVLPARMDTAGIVLAVFLTPLIWIPVYGLLGLVAPAVVIDGLGPARALLRSVRLATRTGLRAALIRFLGYLSWLLIRVALAGAAVALIELTYTSPSPTVDNIIMAACWLVVNALAYPVLGCLDVALHLDVRMRTEGLDIALRRSVHRGVAPDAALAVPTRLVEGQPA